MAVGAYEVALRDLSLDDIPSPKQASGDIESLCRRIPVVELHNGGMEPTAAIHARLILRQPDALFIHVLLRGASSMVFPLTCTMTLPASATGCIHFDVVGCQRVTATTMSHSHVVLVVLLVRARRRSGVVQRLVRPLALEALRAEVFLRGQRVSYAGSSRAARGSTERTFVDRHFACVRSDTVRGACSAFAASPRVSSTAECCVSRCTTRSATCRASSPSTPCSDSAARRRTRPSASPSRSLDMSRRATEQIP